MSTVQRQSYVPAVKGKQRYFLHAGHKIALRLPIIGGAFIGPAIGLTAFAHAPIAGAVSGVIGLTIWGISIVFGVKAHTLTKRELNRLEEILTQFYGDKLTGENYRTMFNLLMSEKQTGIWLNKEDSSINRIAYNEDTGEIEVATRVITQEQYSELYRTRVATQSIHSAAYIHEATNVLNQPGGKTLTTTKQQLTLPTASKQAEALTPAEYSEWAKEMKKNTPPELSTTITEIKALLTAATINQVPQEEAHILQRILRDSTEATHFYQNVKSATTALPQSAELQAEATETLTETLNSLKSEAQKVAARQAVIAMQELKTHANYVASAHN